MRNLISPAKKQEDKISSWFSNLKNRFEPENWLKRVTRPVKAYFTPSAEGVRARDILRELPGAALSVGKEIGQGMLREGAALSALMPNVRHFIGQEKYGQYTPRAEWEKKLYGTDKPISLASIGRELPFAEKAPTPIAIALGAGQAALDFLPSGSEGVKQAAKQIAKEENVGKLMKILKGTLKIEEKKRLKELAKTFVQETEPQRIEKRLQRLLIRQRGEKIIPRSKTESELLLEKARRYIKEGKSKDEFISSEVAKRINEDEQIEKFYKNGDRESYKKRFRELRDKIRGEIEESLGRIYEEARYPHTARISTKLLERIKDQKMVSRQFIQDLLKSSDLKQVEKNLIKRVLENMPESKISTEEFTKRVESELLPIKVSRHMERYEDIVLPEELRGEVSDYYAKVYENPIKNEAGSKHFSTKEAPAYFAHTRVEELPEGIRRIIEVQSDLHQYDMYPQKLSTTKKMNRWLDLLKEYKDKWHKFILRSEIREAAEDGVKRLQFPTGKTALTIEGLSDYHNDLGRIDIKTLEEEVGDTINIDGLLEDILNQKTYERVDTNTKLNTGDIIIRDPEDYTDLWVVTDIIDNNQFKAVPRDMLRELYPNLQLSEAAQRIKKLHPSQQTVFNIKKGFFTKINGEKIPPTRENIGRIIADITKEMGKYKKNSEEYRLLEAERRKASLWKFYEKDVGDFLEKEFGAKRIEDPQGVEWWQINIKPEMARKPVLAFGHTDIESLIAGGIGAMGAALSAPLIADLLTDNKEKNNEEVLHQYFNQSQIDTYQNSLKVPLLATMRSKEEDQNKNNKGKIVKDKEQKEQEQNPLLQGVGKDEMNQLKATILAEGLGEGKRGIKAIFNVIVNRAKRDKTNLFEVVSKPNQFSAYKATKLYYKIYDLLKNNKEVKDKKVKEILDYVDQLLQELQEGTLEDITGGARHYYNPKKVSPYWADKATSRVQIGNHIFLRGL